MSYKPQDEDKYVVKYGETPVGYIVSKNGKFELQPSIKGKDTIVDVRVSPLFGKKYPTKASLEGNLLKLLRDT